MCEGGLANTCTSIHVFVMDIYTRAHTCTQFNDLHV